MSAQSILAKLDMSTRKKDVQTKVGFFVILLLFVFGIGVWSTPLYSQTIPGEKILDFRTHITIFPDSSIKVSESIEYDFDSLQKHGIYRIIPVQYETSYGTQSISLNDISVTDGTGNPYPFTTSLDGNNKEIKIGDASKTISGIHRYVIDYTVSRAIGYFDSYDEIYWNATGNDWKVPILASEATITLPKQIAQSDLRTSCYVGFLGSRDTCQVDRLSSENEMVSEVSFSSPSALSMGSGLTVAVGFPKDIVQKPNVLERMFSYALDNFIVLLPILTFIGMALLWWKAGRGPKGSGVIVAEYESPDNLTPLEVEAILRTKLRASSLSAEIVHLAVRGYLTITRIEKTRFFMKSADYELRLVKDYSDVGNEFDKALLEGLFGNDKTRELLMSLLSVPENTIQPGVVKISELKNTFYKAIPKIQKSVFESVTAKGYYQKNPEKIVKKYVAYPFTALIVLVFFVSNTGLFEGTILFSCTISFLIVVLFGLIMPAKTKAGALIKDKVLGLKEYLQIAEKDRINFHNAPEKNPQLFEKLLPFAMIFGVEKAWAKEFEGMYASPPAWYSDPYHAGMFNAIALSDGLHGFSGVATRSLSSAPGGSSGSGGGGFSGGGGGGGGGGSW